MGGALVSGLGPIGRMRDVGTQKRLFGLFENSPTTHNAAATTAFRTTEVRLSSGPLKAFPIRRVLALYLWHWDSHVYAPPGLPVCAHAQCLSRSVSFDCRIISLSPCEYHDDEDGAYGRLTRGFRCTGI